MDDMTPKEFFMFLFEILKNLNASYVENTMATLGFILLAIGWIITSEKARTFLSSDKTVKLVSISVIAVIALIHTIVSLAIWEESDQIFEQLKMLMYMNEKYYDLYKLELCHVILNLIMNLLAFALLIVLILKSKTELKIESRKTL